MAAQFGPTGGSIGRNEGNTLVLPDEAKTISRQHATITQVSGEFMLADQGANPTLCNGAPVGTGQQVRLRHGDELRIGPYIIRCELPQAAPAFDPNSTQVNLLGGAAPAAPLAPPAMPAAPAQMAPAQMAPAQMAPAFTPPAAQAFPGAGAPAMPAAPFDPFAAPPAAAGLPAAPVDPFADLFAPPAAAVPPPQAVAAPVPMAPPVAAPPKAQAFPGGSIPDDFDPFASLIKEQPKPSTTEAFNPFATGARKVPPPIPFESAHPHDDLLGQAGDKPASIDELFGLGGSSSNPLEVLRPDDGLAAPSAPVPVDDPLALFGGPLNPVGAGSATPDQTPMVDQPFIPPRVVAPEAPRMPPPAAQPAPQAAPAGVSPQAIDDLLAAVGPMDPTRLTTGQFKVAKPVNVDTPQPLVPPPAPPAALHPQAQAPVAAAARPAAPAPGAAATPAGQPSMDVLMAAFCEGLGSPLNLPDGVTEEFMFRMGGLVREAVHGTVDLLNARAVTKREVKASATVIMERNNNPLKFSPDAKTAMLYLVSGRLNPAFMPPITAMRDAYYDLRSHQFGFMAGTKAALEGVLERFEPQQLEGRLASKGLIDSLIPGARKARLWDLFNELYKEIAREAEDDFHALFGQAFLKAYEEHVEALRRDLPDQ